MSILKVNTLQNTSGTTLNFIKQVVTATKTDTATESVSSGAIGSTVSGLTVNITPSSTSSKILILLQVSCVSDGGNSVYVYLVRDSTFICQADADGSRQRASADAGQASEHHGHVSHLSFVDSPSTTSSITYGFKLGHSSGITRTIYLNRPENNNNSNTYARSTSTITVLEVAG